MKLDIPSIVWPATHEDAIIVQNELRHRVRSENDFARLKTVAGIDCSYDIASNLSFAVVVTMRLDALQPLTIVRAQLPTTFPYIPGFLSFREIPVVLEALKQLPALPDLLMVDGQGIAHPRRLGIAAHLGVLLDHPTIGVAKSRLYGSYIEPGPAKGDRSDLIHHKEKIGTVLRGKEKTNPLFISPGHRVSQQTAVDLTLRCLTKYRLPEPTRIADKISKEKAGFAENRLL